MLMKAIRGSSVACKGRRCMATLLVERHGAPSVALRLDPSKATPHPKQPFGIVVSMKASQITNEDFRKIGGHSLCGDTRGVGGSYGVGTVTAGDASDKFSAGDLVFVQHSSLWADSVAIPMESAVKLPKLDSEQAACLPTYLTAWGILSCFQRTVQQGDTLIQNNADSAVAQAIVQLGKLQGQFNVISVTDADLKDAALMSGLRDRKARHMVSGITGRPTSLLLRSLAHGGTMVLYEGLHGPAAPPVDMSVSSAIFGDSHLRGFDLAAWSRTNPSEARQAVISIAELLSKKAISLDPVVFPVSQYLQAFAQAEGSASRPVVLTF